MPPAYSIASGIALGFITYTAVKLLSGQFRAVRPSPLLPALIFIAKYAIF
jgi:adenine/guanine/hypoxanthine permease